MAIRILAEALPEACLEEGHPSLPAWAGRSRRKPAAVLVAILEAGRADQAADQVRWPLGLEQEAAKVIEVKLAARPESAREDHSSANLC